MTRLTIRVYFEAGHILGPGKVQLLELIGEKGSIRSAALAMKMSYRRAWVLLKSTERAFDAPLVATAAGGSKGGGSKLTALGSRVVKHYRSIELSAAKSAKRHITALESARKSNSKVKKSR